jgi:hypothetical protein
MILAAPRRSSAGPAPGGKLAWKDAAWTRADIFSSD